MDMEEENQEVTSSHQTDISLKTQLCPYLSIETTAVKEEEVNVKVELETDEEEEEETNVQQDRLLEPQPTTSVHRSRKQNISIVRKEAEIIQSPNPSLSTIIKPSILILRRKNPVDTRKSQGSNNNNNENLATTNTTTLNSSSPRDPSCKYKTMFRSENGKTIGYVVPVSQPSSSSSITASTFKKATNLQTKNIASKENTDVILKTTQTKKVTSDSILTVNSKAVQTDPPRKAKPLQLQQTNLTADRAKYLDFIHCCKCFSTFYKLRDLTRHFDRCALPYPNANPKATRSFKAFKSQQVSQPPVEKAKEPEPETPAIILEEGEIPTAFTKKVPEVSTGQISPLPSIIFPNPQPKYSNHATKKPRKYKVRRYDLSKRSRPDLKEVDQLVGEPACIDLDSSALTSPGGNMQEDDNNMDQSTETSHLCSECGEFFKTSFSLELHMNRHRGQVGPFKCTVEGCTRQYSARRFLTKHEKLVHPLENQIPCPVDGCSKMCLTDRDLADHKNLVHLKQPLFKCQDETCGQLFNSRRERMNHRIQKHRLKKFKCSVDNCDKAFPCRHSLKKHVSTHRAIRERKTVVCDFPDCTAKFVDYSGLNQHKKIIHNQRSRDFLCPTCGKAFYDKNTLENHFFTHTTDTPHLCSFCGKAFKHLQLLYSHLKSHSQESPYKCSFCERRFKRYQGLRMHLKTHTGERPYSCGYCDKTFITTEHRRRHQQVHTGFRPFECKFCDDTFLEITVVRRHVKRQHSDCDFDLRDPSTYRVKKKPADPILEQDESCTS